LPIENRDSPEQTEFLEGQSQFPSIISGWKLHFAITFLASGPAFLPN